MSLPMVLAAGVVLFLGVGSALNPDLVLTRFGLATGYGTVQVPVILVLVLFAAGSWIVFVVLWEVSQRVLLHRLERQAAALGQKDRDLLRMRAARSDGSMEAFQNTVQLLDRRVRELDALLSGLRGLGPDRVGGPPGSPAVPPRGATTPSAGKETCMTPDPRGAAPARAGGRWGAP